MTIEYTFPFRRGPRQRTFLSEPAGESLRRPPRVARLLALAHKLEGLVRSGEVRDYAELARLGHVSASRASQIMLLLHLAPAIQERVLFLDPTEAGFLAEPDLRKMAREPRWDRQCALFEGFFRHR